MRNFGKIKTVFNDLLIEGIVKKNKDTKGIFKKYIKIIRESEILKTQFLIYNNIENRIDNDKYTASLFISENIKLMDKFKKKDILKENQKLIKLLPQNHQPKDDKLLGEVHESLSSLIFIKKTPDTVGKITADISKLTEYIQSNKPKEIVESIELPVSVLTNIMVGKYNEEYEQLDETDKKVLKVLIGGNLEDKTELYDTIVNECKVLIDTLIPQHDEEGKNKLFRVKEKLTLKEDISEDNFITKISKLIDLKNNLSD